MGKKYTTDEIHVGGHNLNASMMVNLNSLVTDGLHSDAGYALVSHTHDGRYYTESESNSRFVNVTGDTMSGNLDVNADIQGNSFSQAASGIPRNNLGTPTITEMALFEQQFKPQTTLANDYNDLTDLTFWVQTTSSSSWTEITTYSDDHKRRFLRTMNSSVVIPNGCYKFRVEFKGKGYNYANALSGYWSSNSHRTQVHIWKYNFANTAWTQHTSSTTEISSWPGHMYLPFSTIPWHETTTTSTGHYRYIRIEFTPSWTPYSGSGTDYSGNNMNLYGLQIWGGYPSGRRTPHYYDQNGRLSTWGNFEVNGDAIVDGDVGIGTTDPQHKFDVYMNTSAKYAGRFTQDHPTGYGVLIDVDSTSVNQPALWVKNASTTSIWAGSNGNVGIGTTGPNYKLEVDGTFSSNAIWTTASSVTEWGNGTTAYGTLTWGTNYAKVFANSGKQLHLAAGGASTDMVIDTNGNVGIGTTIPDAQLEISNNETGNGVGGATLRLTRSDSTSVAGDPVGTIEFYSTDADTAKTTAYIKSMSEELYGRQGSLAFGVSQSINTDATEAMRIDSSGRVGIGTTAPSQKLHVVGDAIFSGNLTFKPKHYSASDDLNSDARNIFSTHSTNGSTANRPVNYSSVYTLGGNTSNALQISTNEDYSESGMWIRQYNQNPSSPQGTGWQNWTEVWTTNHAPLSKITNWNAAYTHSTAAHAPANAEANVQSDWNATSGDALILNKPTDIVLNNGNTYSKSFSGDVDDITGFNLKRVQGFTGTDHRAFTDHHNLITLPNTSSTQYDVQLAFQTGTSSLGGAKFRSSTAGTWTDWYTFYHEGHKPTYSELGTMSYSNLTGTPTIPTDHTGLYLPLTGGTVSGNLTVQGTTILDSLQMEASSDYITFYGGNSTQHSISSRQINGAVGDDLRFNTYGSFIINLDSNNNQGSAANSSFYIARHGGASGDLSSNILFDIDGENGDATFTGNVGIGTPSPAYKLDVNGSLHSTNLNIADGIYHEGDTNTYMQFHASDQWRVVTGGSERLEVNNTQTTVAGNLQVNGSIYTSSYIYHTGDTNTFMRFPAADTISWNTSGTERMRINSSGNIGIGTTAPTNKLHVTGTIYGNGGIIGSSDLLLKDQSSAYSTELKMQNNTHTIGIDYQNNETLRFITRSGTTTVPITFAMRTGNITCVSLTQSSDERLKENIVPLSEEKIDVKWKSFNIIGNNEYRTGVVAQELEQNHPEFVNTNDEGFKSVKYIDLLIAKIAELETRIKQLENN